MKLSPSVAALAAGDLGRWSGRFARAGWVCGEAAPGTLSLCRGGGDRVRVLLSVGVHGDETAPVEMLAGLLDGFANAPNALAVDLMIAVGNPPAIAAGKRFVEADLNRMFRVDRGELEATAEARRADAIIAAVEAFFGGPSQAWMWHLDLHTAIRASKFPTFAVVPETVEGQRRAALLSLLGHGAIEAAIFNPARAGTFSAWSARHFGALSATLELGRIGHLGRNDMTQLAPVRQALGDFLASGRVPPGSTRPRLFRVARELIKHSENFRPHFGPETANFSPFTPGALIAEDGEVVYRAGDQVEYIVFPNPEVRVGLRAGLMAVSLDAEA